MARELKPLDISHSPEVLRLAEEVQRTREPRLLQRDRQDVAVLLPVTPAPRRSAARARAADRDLESIRGAAGSLKQPLAWKEMVEIAREDRLRVRSPDAE